MRIRCVFGIHKMHKMPWMKTRDRSPKPDYACLECGKIKYNWVMYVHSIEVGLFDSMGPQYEGQSPPEGYDSWSEYWNRMEEARQAILKKLRNKI